MKPYPVISTLVFAALAVLLAVLLVAGDRSSSGSERPILQKRIGDFDERVSAFESRAAGLEALGARIGALEKQLGRQPLDLARSASKGRKDAQPPARDAASRATSMGTVAAEAEIEMLSRRLKRTGDLAGIPVDVQATILEMLSEDARAVRDLKDSDVSDDVLESETRKIRLGREQQIRDRFGDEVFNKLKGVLPRAAASRRKR